LLKANPVFAPARPNNAGLWLLTFEGAAKSIADMEEGIAAEAKRRHARNRANLIIRYLVNDDHAETGR
jgi:hypothetical protein